MQAQSTFTNISQTPTRPDLRLCCGHGCTIPRAPNRWGGRQKAPTMSQLLSSIECIYFQKPSCSSMGAPNLLLVLDAI